jgi:hypothetical protein
VPGQGSCPSRIRQSHKERPQHASLLDLLAEDNRLTVYAGELEVRPPGAPTTQGGNGAAHPSILDYEGQTRYVKT